MKIAALTTCGGGTMRKMFRAALFAAFAAALLFGALPSRGTSATPRIVAPSAGATADERDFSKQQARANVPAWARDGVVYEIFTRNFSEAGTFNAVTAQLDRLQELGVNILWLMPIHPSGQEKKKGTVGSPYAVRDFYAVNPDYGTKEDFKRLVAEAHKRKMKVIIDVVANHTAWDSVMMRTPGFHTRDAGGRVVAPDPGWIDVADLNYENAALRDYMIEMLKVWLREYDLDGFRCDVAWMVPTDFWERARVELERIKPDIFLLAEASEPDLMLKAFDADYAWPFFHAVVGVATGSTPATQVRAAWEEERRKFPRGSLHLRFTDNHDERRAVVEFGRRGALAASTLILTLDGIPLIYNGMEAGDTTESGDPALFEKMPIFWAIARRRPEYPRFYKKMIALRRAHAALTRGEVAWLRNSDERRVVSYARRAGGEEFLVAINFSNEPFVGFVETAGTFVEVTPDITTDAASSNDAARAAAVPALALDAWGFRIFRRQK